MRSDRHKHKKKSKAPKAILSLIVILGLLGMGGYALQHFGVLDGLLSGGPQEQSQQEQKDPEQPQMPYEEQRAEEILAEMSLEEKVYQMFIISPESLLVNYDAVTAAGDITKAALKECPIGGLLYSKPNFESKDQILTMINNTQSYSELGLFVSVDEEGGNVSRLMSTFRDVQLEPMFNYKDQGAETARENARTIGSYIAGYGFNLDFAPVADVWSNPANTVIGTRAYSDDYLQAAELVSAAVQGFHDEGMICTLKHFPGHGDTAEDSHYSSAYVKKTKEQLQQEEWVPFKAGIEAGADMVMVGHQIVPEIEEVPATVSKVIVTDILRGELGFEGVVVTDSLKMAAVNSNYSSENLVIKCIEAGSDMLLDPSNFRSAAKAVVAAVDSGVISEERIDESVKRILKLKIQYGIIE
ncbi:MAG: glycoside hydrolase family 3 protein [Clostridiales bacterium]|nr:glycoside hydrolase family 3 protein [Clostridiales bacterium]